MEIISGPANFKTVRNQLAKILHINFNITFAHELVKEAKVISRYRFGQIV